MTDALARMQHATALFTNVVEDEFSEIRVPIKGFQPHQCAEVLRSHPRVSRGNSSALHRPLLA
jgi:hypothetical protein